MEKVGQDCGSGQESKLGAKTFNDNNEKKWKENQIQALEEKLEQKKCRMREIRGDTERSAEKM